MVGGKAEELAAGMAKVGGAKASVAPVEVVKAAVAKATVAEGLVAKEARAAKVGADCTTRNRLRTAGCARKSRGGWTHIRK